MPTSVGGFDTPAIQFCEVVEELARAYASTTWSMMANGAAKMVGFTFCTDEHVKRMFSSRQKSVMVATYAPSGKAVGDGAAGVAVGGSGGCAAGPAGCQCPGWGPTLMLAGAMFM